GASTLSRILGIDLGAYSVKVAVVSPGFRSATVVDYFERPVPPAGDDPSESHALRAARVLGEIIREERLDQESPYAALSGDRVFIHVLEFAFRNLRRPELAKAVGAELESVLPIELEEMVYAFDPLPRDVGRRPEPVGLEPGAEPAMAALPLPPFLAAGKLAAPSEGMRVLSCAARIDRVRELLDLLENERAEPRGIIAAPTSYPRLIERIAHAAAASGAPAPDQGPVAVVDIGHERTDVCVVVGGRAVFARTIARGGRQLTESIARVWRLSWAQAESAKHQDGFVASTLEPAQSEAWSRIHEALVPELAPLVRDLRQTLLACRARTGATAERVLLVGGGARLRGLASYLSEQLQMPVSMLGAAEDHAVLGPRLQGMGARADVAFLAAGVAFEGASGRGAFDLRQGDLSFKADLSFLRAKAMPLAAAAIVVMAFAAISAYANLYKLRKSEAALSKRLALESAEVFGSQLSARDVLQRVSPQGGAGDNPMPKMTAYDLLLGMNTAIPAKDQVKIDIEELDIKPTKIVVRAVSGTTDTREPLQGIKLLEDSLKKWESPGKLKCFADFPPPESQPGKDGGRNFTLTIKTPCL
ncbi:MAG TPA: pilus assembly protein PilM, partial [Kofleriaceae bacterium]|nr:pilus assembly protein PilM [Kofleriaceae bacterium]